jgi:aldehyde:ferredoxin oxidoreductase
MAEGTRRVDGKVAIVTGAGRGIGREADTLPKKFFNHPLQGGKSEGQTLDYDRWREAVDTYYRMCGWDVQTGYPTREKLESLGLDWIAEMLR